LPGNVRTATRVLPVVEDRISQQDNMWHAVNSTAFVAAPNESCSVDYDVISTRMPSLSIITAS
jgi:hypothetical protein